MRLEKFDRDELTPDQDALYEWVMGGHKPETRTASPFADDEGRLQGPFVALMHSPNLGLPLLKLGRALVAGGTLPIRARELGILAVTAHWRCDYEWSSHASNARKVGFSGEQIDALRTGSPLTIDDALEQAALDTARALVGHTDLDDAEYAAAHAVLTDEQLVELTTTVGFYGMVALTMRTFRIPAPVDVSFD